MQINGKEVDFKISRLEDASRFELALQNMKKEEESIKKIRTSDKSARLSEVIGKMISMFKKFFNETTGEDVLGECKDLDEAKNAYIEFLKEVSKQKQEMLTFTLEDIK